MSETFQSTVHQFSRAGQSFSVLEVLFCDPSSRNSFSVATAKELELILSQLDKKTKPRRKSGSERPVSPIRALLFRADGRVFCSGGNLKDHRRLGKLKGLRANREIARVLKKLDELSIPTVALVEGNVFGGGIELLSAFDIVFSIPHVEFGFWQRKIGLMYGWGGGGRLKRRLGITQTSRLALTAAGLTSQEAFALGLVDRLVPKWCAHPEALAETIRLASLPLAAGLAIKSLSRSTSGLANEFGDEAASAAFKKLWYGVDHQAALERFQHKSALNLKRSKH